jgi:hypothetical protein
MTGTTNALLIGAAGILCLLALWQQARIERAVEWAYWLPIRMASWVVGIVRQRRTIRPETSKETA